LAALAAVAETTTPQRELARVLSRELPEPVSQPTARKWLLEELPNIARRTVSLRDPHRLGLLVVQFLFDVPPAAAVSLAHELAAHPSVSRVDRLSGRFSVGAEIVAVEQRQIDLLVVRWQPALVHVVTQHVDQLPDVLLRLARSASD
jgi:hypothetical protein